MSKKNQEQDDKQKPPLIFYFIILAFIVLVLLNFIGDYTQKYDDSTLTAAINGILEFQQIQLVTDDNMILILKSIGDDIIALKSYDETISLQIGNIRADIKSKFPQAADVITQEQTSITSTTPFLTLKMQQQEFFVGNTIFFTGTGQPNSPIFITLKDPTRELWQIPISKSEIINGSYIANYTLRLDDPIGTWTVYARQLSDTTKTLTFTVE